MSTLLISHSSDLQRLQSEGYDVEVRSDVLLVKHVPYVTNAGTVEYGTLVSELSIGGSSTITPNTHVVWFVGSIPHDHRGRELTQIIHQRTVKDFGGGVRASCSFSSKPPGGYADYYAKMTAYANILSGHAAAIDPGVTARTFSPIRMDDSDSVFRYVDSASSRAQIGVITQKLELAKVVIVGVGGTGSYILDLVAKTPVREVHLYDADTLYAHNAFRAPGAVPVDQLDTRPKKVDHFRDQYDVLRRNIVAHGVNVDETNVEDLRDASFVFLAMDTGVAKKFIIQKLEEFHVPFIDCGMGIGQIGESLAGIVRITTSVEGHRQHVWEMQRISFADPVDDDYDQNVQVADLNMLNAALAVIKWKKLMGFYVDEEQELSTMYTIDGNALLNEDFQ